VWELQRERLITAGYLASDSVDSVDLVLAQEAVDDTAEALRVSLGTDTSDELVEALARVGSLEELREGALRRGVSLDSVARAYHAVIEAVIQALRLVPQKTSDAEGTRQLTALDALLRANEESALRGMSLIVAAASPQTGRPLLSDSSAQAQMFTETFIEQADREHSALVVLVDQGESARRVAELAGRLPDVSSPATVARFVTEALAAVESQASLRRLVQDRVIREIADSAAGRADTAQAVAWTIGLGTAVLIVVVMALVVVVSRSIANPLHRLTRAATTVADLAQTELVRVTDEEGSGEGPPQLAAIELASGDEIGELAVAFNRVQATAALLVERQTVTRRNVGMMFTNVAQRTRNLVSQQLAVVDELERHEQNSELLSRLYRLDHLSTRLRRNAENLLVVAGARTEPRVKGPTPVATLLRAALTEIEEYQRVQFGSISDVTVSATPASDLVLVFAELLENAAVFSPPESLVDVSASVTPTGECRVSIVDHGIGMTAQRMAQENHRLVERERLDIAPTTVLGLFVVGRIARRHGMTVELAPTLGGGTTAHVSIPNALFRVAAIAGPVAGAAAGAPEISRARVGETRGADQRGQVGPARAKPAAWPPTGNGRTLPAVHTMPAVPTMPALPASFGPIDGFSWFAPGEDPPPARRAIAPGPAPGPAPTPPPGPPPGYVRAAVPAVPAVPAQRSGGEEPLSSHPTTRPGGTGKPASLVRRVPGANLAPGIKAQLSGGSTRQGGWQARSPDAIRDAFDSYTTGLVLGKQQASEQTYEDR
jgi:signal transduction histidine kinase